MPLLPFLLFFFRVLPTERASRRTNIANNGAIKTGGTGVSSRGDGVIKMKTEGGMFEIRMKFGTLPFNPFNVVVFCNKRSRLLVYYFTFEYYF